VPLVYFLCWLPSPRLVKAAPLAWLARTSPAALAGIMTCALLASCILFMAGRGALEAHQLALYWIIKLAAIFLALFASMTLTTVWEEWVIWRLSSRPDGTGFFASALRANLYVFAAGHASSCGADSPQEATFAGLLRPKTQRGG